MDLALHLLHLPVLGGLPVEHALLAWLVAEGEVPLGGTLVLLNSVLDQFLVDLHEYYNSYRAMDT